MTEARHPPFLEKEYHLCLRGLAGSALLLLASYLGSFRSDDRIRNSVSSTVSRGGGDRCHETSRSNFYFAFVLAPSVFFWHASRELSFPRLLSYNVRKLPHLPIFG